MMARAPLRAAIETFRDDHPRDVGLTALGLALAVIGLYGVMAYSVSRQTGEMGLRMVLGARPAAIFRMVSGWGAKLVAAGLLLGLMGALALTRFLEGSLI
jgi:ABC-type antimicrobial peptide transport system permease subunit